MLVVLAVSILLRRRKQGTTEVAAV